MKHFLFVLTLTAFSLTANAQTKPKTTKIENKIVEISCGECQFKMKGEDCDLAVRIDGQAYFVDGKNIDDFGDAHAKDGFCKAIRKAEVTGEIIDNRFKAKSIELVKDKK
jgi:hypothetical protein